MKIFPRTSSEGHFSLWKSSHVRCLTAALAFLSAMYICGVAFSFQDTNFSRKYLVADDSMITLRIANNFAHRLGLYFNAGERTAANTSLFWPVLISPIFRICWDLGRCIYILPILSSACMALTISLIVFSADDLLIALSSGITLLLLSGVAEYGSTIWEHIPQTLLVTLAFGIYTGQMARLRVYRREACLGLLSLAFLVRPDTLPLMLPVIADLWWKRQPAARFRVPATALTIAAIAAYYLLHYSIYGTFAPNTYHLKVSFGLHSIFLGLHYILLNIVQSAIPAFAFSVIVLACYRKRNFTGSTEFIVPVAICFQILYIIAVGGDNFLYGRFFLLIGPISVFLLWRMFWSGRFLSSFYGRFLRTLTVASALILVVGNFAFHLNRLQKEAPVYAGHAITLAPEPLAGEAALSEFLRAHIRPKDGQIGLFALGALSYYMPDYKFADFLGKADSVIASEPPEWGAIGHNKWDYPYTLSNRNVSVVPSFFMDQKTAEAALQKHEDFGFLAAFHVDPWLHAHYTYLGAEQIGAPGTIGLFVRNDLVSRFAPANADEAP